MPPSFLPLSLPLLSTFLKACAEGVGCVRLLGAFIRLRRCQIVEEFGQLLLLLFQAAEFSLCQGR